MDINKDRTIAAFFSLIAFALFVVMDSISKYLADYCSVIQIVWGRYFFHIGSRSGINPYEEVKKKRGA